MTSEIADTSKLVSRVRERAANLGFDAFGITAPDSITEAGARLAEFLAHGRHGDMNWLEDTYERRVDPRQLMPTARSVVVVGMSYGPEDNPLGALEAKSKAAISVYAKGRDYHDVMKGRLKEIAGLIARGTDGDVKVFVDTAALMEKPLAAAAGLGWQGKHTNLVSRQHGSWLFLGVILSDAELAPCEPEADHCGSCRRCIDICPTDAFPAPYQLDARRCIAYLTVEYHWHIDRQFRKPIGNRVFGCDDCLAVCPWNKFAGAAREAKLTARIETDNPPLADLLALDDSQFRTRFAGTPVKRSGRARFLRNCLIAAGNSSDATLLPAIADLLDDPSELVRAMAVWALGELAAREEFEALRSRYLTSESDSDVITEWRQGEPD